MRTSGQGMPRRFAQWILIAIGMVIAAGCLGERSDASIHRCSGAGRWFPDDPNALRATVERYLDAPQSIPPVMGRIRALIVPHAGYPYCGPVAGCAYRLLRGQSIDRVIILGISHNAPLRDASVLDVEAYETPLGRVPVDREMTRALLASKGFTSNPNAHATEHSDENQIPFLQVAVGSFRMVSILVGNLDQMERVSKAISPWLDEHTVLVASSDFTHYGGAFAYRPFHDNLAVNLRALDGEAAYWLIRRDRPAFQDYCQRTKISICGQAPLCLMLNLLGPGPPATVLKYDRSGGLEDVQVPSVSYLAIAYADSPPSESSAPDWVRPAAAEAQISRTDQTTLLRLARASIGAAVHDQTLDMTAFNITPRLMVTQAAFVTLEIHNDLRGCIGTTRATSPLYDTIGQMARKAALNDPRFAPVRADELKNLHLEISLLLAPDGTVANPPMQTVNNIEEIRVGEDGLIVRSAAGSGLLLPQIPVKYGWTRDDFLIQICRKAGLAPDAWKTAQLERFCAQIFSEGPP